MLFSCIDLPTSLIEATLRPLGTHLDCHLCQYNLRDRIRDVTMHWLNVKVSLPHFIFLVSPWGTSLDVIFTDALLRRLYSGQFEPFTHPPLHLPSPLYLRAAPRFEIEIGTQ